MTPEDKIKKLEEEVEKYKRLSEIDDLTLLYNRRKLTKDIERYLEIQKRSENKFTIIMIDINKFKTINDTRGHKVGDEILIKLSRILENEIRKYEKVYRIGGDEFVIILSHGKKIKNVIDRIKQKIKPLNLSISVGYGGLKSTNLEYIDRKMYKDKGKTLYHHE